MHSDTIKAFRHDHGLPAFEHHESRTRWVVILTAAMMVGELIVGKLTNSMALTADGWHMASHTGALGLSLIGYWFARTRANDRVFSFGTGKVFAMAGYTSAVALTLVALLMLVESVSRFLDPLPISFDHALPVAILGLVVNLASAKLLHVGHDQREHHHHSGHDHGEQQAEHHGHARLETLHHEADEKHRGHAHGGDHNLQAAYLHVLADALTSVLAIFALLGGRYFGFGFLDPAMGIVGGLVIMKWGIGLCLSAGRQLLDAVPSEQLVSRIRSQVEAIGDAQVADLHLWDIGPGQHACIVSLVTSDPMAPSVYRAAIEQVAPVSHITVEVEKCPGHHHLS